MATFTKKDTIWTDESGVQVPYTRLHPSERLREKSAVSILQDAIKINKALYDFKEMIRIKSMEVLAKVTEENNAEVKDRKGNFTWYSFDRTIKVEVSINDRIEFDEILINLCKEKLDEFLKDNLQGVEEFVRELVNSAFENTKGKLDSKKVMSLLRYRSKIKDHRYGEAMELLEKSIRRPDSKTYFRVWEKDSSGEYKSIDLNFSSI